MCRAPFQVEAFELSLRVLLALSAFVLVLVLNVASVPSLLVS